MWRNVRAAALNATLQLLVIYRFIGLKIVKTILKLKEKLFLKKMTWKLMWRNVRAVALNATLQLLVIYRI